MSADLSYDVVGATCPAAASWPATPPGWRRHERTVLLGEGDLLWRRATREVLTWGVKTRSGFAVSGSAGRTVQLGNDHQLTARVGPLRVHEPVRVVAVVEQPDRCGFAYGTRPGHPVRGEEAFVVSRDGDGAVRLTLRSLTRPAPGPWRLAFPAILVAQHWYRFRYAAALRDLDRPEGSGTTAGETRA